MMRRSSGVQEFRSSGVQEFRSSGVQEFRSSGVQEWGGPQISSKKSPVTVLWNEQVPLLADSLTPRTSELLNS
jgi:hypothetical protein